VKSPTSSPSIDRVEPVLDWLLRGDPSVCWQVLRDLEQAAPRLWKAERAKVAREGWGARLLKLQDPAGTWSERLYSPKWTSTTYTLQLLRRFGLGAEHPAARKACDILLKRGLAGDGGIDFSSTRKRSETCITGMVLAMTAAFRPEDPRIERLVDYLLAEQMPDGGWNCQRDRGAVHSSFHTTINVLEGLRGYAEAGGARVRPTMEAEAAAREFFLEHGLYRSHRTGEVVRPEMTRCSFPPRWYHDILRTLDYFQAAAAPRDVRLEDPIGRLVKKRRADGRWPLQNRHPGRTFFELEQVGRPSRWNTLRALRVLNWWSARP